VLADARAYARVLADGPTLAHATTKRLLHEAWAMPLDDEIELEAQAQARLMQSEDFRRAYRAFLEKRSPKFEGN